MLTGKCSHCFFSDMIYFQVYLFKIADNLQIIYVNAEAGLLDPESYRIRECTTFWSADPDIICGQYLRTIFVDNIRGQNKWTIFVDKIRGPKWPKVSN